MWFKLKLAAVGKNRNATKQPRERFYWKEHLKKLYIT